VSHFNYSPEGRGFTVPAPLEDRTVLLPRVRTAAPAPIMAAPADEPLTAEHRKALDELETLAQEARKHLAGWDGRESDSDPAAVAAMGWAIAAVKRLVKVGAALQRDLVFEDSVTAVDDGREAYEATKAYGQAGSA
jgi:hypothetical protein